MTRRSRAFAVALAGAVVALSFATRGAHGGERAMVGDTESPLRTFHERVDAYAMLHRRVAPPPIPMVSADPVARLLSGNYLASAIRSQRSAARQGDIFSDEIASMFRHRLADSIGERDGETFLAELNGGFVPPQGMHPTVNEVYSMARLFRMPSEVGLGLPPLPAELDYRIAAHDLLLWDIAAGIVVDFVPDAFVTPVVTEE